MISPTVRDELEATDGWKAVMERVQILKEAKVKAGIAMSQTNIEPEANPVNKWVETRANGAEIAMCDYFLSILDKITASVK